MSSQCEPHVALVIPVYNAADTLERCVRSVLNQNYQNWSLFIVDNVSTDESADIGAKLACADERVQLIRHNEHLPMLQNWNRALSLLPEQAVYCKQLNVDDELLPEFLNTMVSALQRHPTAVLASSYFQYGRVRLPRVNHDRTVCLSGQFAARCSFFGRSAYLVHPSAMLMRRNAVADYSHFYATCGFPSSAGTGSVSALADVNAFLSMVDKGDVVFIPEILSNIADRDDSTTGSIQCRGGWHPGRLDTILKHGKDYLNNAEWRKALQITSRRYLRSLTWRMLTMQAFRDPDFRQYQSRVLTQLLPELKGTLSWEYYLLSRFSKWFSADLSGPGSPQQQVRN